MNIVLPMAGRGQRFKQLYPQVPKMLIDVAGRPMFYWALDSLKKVFPLKNITFICLEEHVHQHFLADHILAYEQQAKIQVVKEIPQGQAESVFSAKSLLNLDEPLLIYNCDTYTDFSLTDGQLFQAATDLRAGKAHGSISVFRSKDPSLSYVTLGRDGFVTSIEEKNRVSFYASTGLYYFSSTQLFMNAVKETRKLISPDEEMYVAHIYNLLIERGYRFTIHRANQCYPLGTPEQLEIFRKQILN